MDEPGEHRRLLASGLRLPASGFRLPAAGVRKNIDWAFLPDKRVGVTVTPAASSGGNIRGVVTKTAVCVASRNARGDANRA